MGLDIGSTTVKAVVLEGDHTVYADYRRHHADVRGELRTLVGEIADAFGETPCASRSPARAG